MTKLTLTQVKAAIKNNGSWKGYFVGNKVNEYHIKDGWHLGCYMEINSLEELTSKINSFMFYLESELGNRVAFYQD